MVCLGFFSTFSFLFTVYLASVCFFRRHFVVFHFLLPSSSVVLFPWIFKFLVSHTSQFVFHSGNVFTQWMRNFYKSTTESRSKCHIRSLSSRVTFEMRNDIQLINFATLQMEGFRRTSFCSRYEEAIRFIFIVFLPLQALDKAHSPIITDFSLYLRQPMRLNVRVSVNRKITTTTSTTPLRTRAPLKLLLNMGKEYASTNEQIEIIMCYLFPF